MNEVIDVILFSNIINVAIVVALFIWLFRKFNLLSFVYKKRDEIIETLQKLEHDKKLKEHDLDVTKTKVKNLEHEVFKIMDDGEQVAAGISDKIVEEAEKEAAAMQKKAHVALENEEKIAENEIVEEVTQEAFALAGAKINQAIDERMHQKYINSFIEKLDDLNE